VPKSPNSTMKLWGLKSQVVLQTTSSLQRLTESDACDSDSFHPPSPTSIRGRLSAVVDAMGGPQP
jgi:hypothetical protein